MSFPIFFFTLLPLLFHYSRCTTVIVDGSSEWKNPTVHIGDSITFDLYNFTQATLLTNPNIASYTWHPSRLGFFYFSFNDGSLKACQASQKLAIKVITTVATTTTPHASAMPPAPFSDEVSPSPLFPWHYNNPLHAASPGPSPSTSVTAPMVPYKSSCMPFISSNPAVPLPTDEVDSASSIHPLPTSWS
ncbi:hypothetical protein D0Y65_026093 [Glycine soja]|uniref:Uclacyanin 1 n=1 Tax=Glycine soja TaxID=3848 RepID=A0A445IIA2_GLYSO|nr:hypothetical protein D0Y65_026093 [Glycine soja]